MKVSDLPSGTWMLLDKAHEYAALFWVNPETGSYCCGSKGWVGRLENDILIWDGDRLFFLWHNTTCWTDDSKAKGAGEVGGGHLCEVSWDNACGCWRM